MVFRFNSVIDSCSLGAVNAALARLLAGILLIPATLTPAAEPSKPPPLSAKRIVFVGDSITYGGEYVEFVEAFLRLQHPDWTGDLLNLGLPSETVSGLSESGHAGGAFPRPDLHERLDRVLAQTKPDLVIVCYGMNDGIYQPLAEDRYKAFRDGMDRLHAKVVAAGAAIVHLTPAVYDAVAAGQAGGPSRDYDAVLDRYSQWLLGRRSDGWVVLDIHGPMRRLLDEQRGKEPAFRLAGDGVHPGTAGHWLMARPLLEHFGAPREVTESASPSALSAFHPRGEAVLKLVQKRQRLLKDTWLTSIGHKRPGMSAGQPMAKAEADASSLLTEIRKELSPR